MWKRQGAATRAERELVLACAGGDHQAWDRFVNEHQRLVYSLVLRLVGQEEAEDITQDVFLRAFRSLPAFRGECRLSTWLYRIAINLCRDNIRRHKRRPQSFYLDDPILADEGSIGRQLADPSPTPQERFERSEFGKRLEIALAQLSEAHRSVIVLHDLQELSYAEVAQIIGCSLGTVKSRLFYARRRLSQLLRDDVTLDSG